MTVVLVGEEEITIAHVGDSRAYLFREGGLEKLTRDHSLVDELLRQGKLTPEEAREHPQRSVITRAVGPESDVEVDTDTWQMKDGDLLLVCSDGLTTMIGEDVIAGILATSRGVRDAGQALIDAANDAGGRDNITVILLRLEEVGGGTAAVAEQETSAGDATLRTADVQAALEAQRRERPVATMEPLPRRAEPASRRIEPVAPSGPSRPGAGRRPRSPRLRKLFIALIAATIVGFPLIGGAFLAIRSVYFVGADDQGYVAVFRGLPYELPFGVELYQKNYVTPVTRDAVPEARRQAVLEEQKLRSQDDAYDLVAALERGEVDR
jgi:protein phosphatase